MPSYKNFIAFTIGSIVLISNYGCRKYIEQEPISELSVADSYSSVDNAFKSILGVYDELQGDNGYGIRVSLYYPFDSDEAIVSGGIDNGRRGIGRYQLQLSNTELRNPFVQLYRGVEKANLAIDQIPTSVKYTTGTAQEQRELKRIYGEALTLRAQFYLELIRNWGDVPAPMIPAYKQTDIFLQKNDRDSTYDKLLADLAEAKDLLPWRTEVARDERITKGAVMALRARMALYRGGYSLRGKAGSLGTMQRSADYLKYYTIARDECAALMLKRDQHTLNPDFENIWRSLTSFKYDPAGEIMFEVGAGGGNSNSDSRQGNYNGIRTDQGNRYGPGGGGVIMLPTYYYAFDSVDTRKEVTVGTYRIPANNIKAPQPLTGLTDGKYRRDWRVPLLPTGLNVGYNWALIRFSDVLLMFAEAENELNGAPTTAAKSALEEVRKRAFKGNESRIAPIPGDKAGFFTAIMDERFLEFGGEGIRKFDLIRWNKLAEKINPSTGEVRVKLRQLAAGTGEYSNVPQYLYYRNIGEEIQYLNSRYQSDANFTPPSGSFTRISWRDDLLRTNNTLDVGTGTPAHFIDAIAYYFTPGKSELFPFDLATMQSYQGRLEQNPGY